MGHALQWSCTVLVVAAGQLVEAVVCPAASPSARCAASLCRPATPDPHLLTPCPIPSCRQWSDLEPGTRPSRAAHYSGWPASQAAIRAALEEHAPIDGLLGFSQGATAAALFLAHAQLPEEDGPEVQQAAAQQQQQQQQQAGSPGKPPQPQQQQQQQRSPEDSLRFAVIIAGFLPRDASYADALRRGCPTLPSLHVVGAADALVPEERSAGLWGCFAPGSVETYQHPGAHMVRRLGAC